MSKARNVTAAKQHAAMSAAPKAKPVAVHVKKHREQHTLSASEVSQLGLRNGATPEEIQARIDQVFPPA